jgi:hypothetical protein
MLTSSVSSANRTIPTSLSLAAASRAVSSRSSWSKNEYGCSFWRRAVYYSLATASNLSPHWQRGETKGPSQGNDVVHSRVKARVETLKSSNPYIGPVYCLSGRSIVWGLFALTIDEKTLNKYFPTDVKNDLGKWHTKGGWYHEALKLFSWHAATKPRYPNIPGAQNTKEEDAEVRHKKDSENEPWESGEMPHGREEDKWTEPRAGKAKL